MAVSIFSAYLLYLKAVDCFKKMFLFYEVTKKLSNIRSVKTFDF